MARNTKTDDLDDDLFDETDDEFDDEFDDARPGFVTLDDLKDRLLLIRPSEVGTRESKIKGQGDYEYVVCEEVVVLTGDTTELIDAVPHVLEDFQMWGQNVVSTLKPKIRRRRWVLGVLGQQKAKSFNTQAWVLKEPSDADRARATKYLKARKAAMAKADPHGIDED